MAALTVATMFLGVMFGWVLWGEVKTHRVAVLIGELFERIDRWWLSRYIARLTEKPHNPYAIIKNEKGRSVQDALYSAAGGCGCRGCEDYSYLPTRAEMRMTFNRLTCEECILDDYPCVKHRSVAPVDLVENFKERFIWTANTHRIPIVESRPDNLCVLCGHEKAVHTTGGFCDYNQIPGDKPHRYTQVHPLRNRETDWGSDPRNRYRGVSSG